MTITPEELIKTVTVAERLKDTIRHCYTAKGRPESVAEHSWMTALIAFLLKDEFPGADMDKVIKMLLIHDLGECFTGDIPTFDKTAQHEKTEEELLSAWVGALPEKLSEEMCALYAEMNARETQEAKIYKAIDSLEALIQHNISDFSTWTAHERELNMTYADDKVAFSDYLIRLRQVIREDSIEKILDGMRGEVIEEDHEHCTRAFSADI